ncbi:MAG: cytochrome b/b6 domain-containing protein [Candidatus Neomarinimicrobiota bacterium]
MRSSRDKKTTETESFQRFSLHFRIQHIVLFLSVIALILTGIPLWFSLGTPGDIRWSQDTIRALGGITIYRQIHLIAAIALIMVSLWHLTYLIFVREGRREFAELLPRWKDFTDLGQNSLYFLGLRKVKPRFDRYTYYEKFDYWAVYWGCVIMIGTGTVLWFPEITERYLPWLTYTLAVEIHADEAVLAAVALFVWHFYNVHFKPSRFPGSLSWWHGRTTGEEMMNDHPMEYEKLAKKSKSKNEPH